MILLGLSSVSLVLHKLLISACRPDKAFRQWDSESRSGSRWHNAILFWWSGLTALTARWSVCDTR